MHSKRVSNIESFLNKYDWHAIKYPSKIEDWKKFEGNNQAVAFTVFYEKEMQICPTCNKKYNSTCEK